MRPLARSIAAGALAMAAGAVLAGCTAAAAPPASAGGGAPEFAIRYEPPAEPDYGAIAREYVAGLSTRERAAAIVMGSIPSTDPATLHEDMARTGIGGFILMGANVPGDPQRLRDVTAALAVDPGFPPLVAIDEEGGDVARLPWDDLPSARTLKSAPPADTEAAFAARAALLQEGGVDVNFGIVADVTDDRGMFIYPRALGTTPEAAAERVAAAVAGERGVVASTLKHFPGHGAAPGDSHRSLPTTALSAADWASTDAVPFAAGIDAGAQLLMFGHLVYTSVDAAPASLSAEWHRIAREQLGFEGVAITDDLGMLESSGRAEYADPVANAVAAVAAGNDMVLSIVGTDAGSAARLVDGIAAAADSGALDPARLAEAAARVLALRAELAAS
jgi:beta-N-acetylhexosaminidase